MAKPSFISAAASGISEDTRGRLARALDLTFFWIGTLSSIWLITLLAAQTFRDGFAQLWFVIPIYVLLAYLVLPRVHTALSRIYLPDYFIGRARTREGILGDPLNLGFLGSDAQLQVAMTAAGWTPADLVNTRSSWRIIVSTITRRSYPEAPVSDLYVFGRPQDFAFQREVDGNPGQRHHVRFWKAPDGWLLPGGHQVGWIAGGTYDRSVGFSLFTLQVTHKIEQDTDVERDFIVDSLRNSPVPAKISVIENFSTGYHARNGGGDSIATDGDLPIVDLRGVVVPELEKEAIAAADGRATTAAAVSLMRAARPIGTTLGSILVLLRSGAWLSASIDLMTNFAVTMVPGVTIDSATAQIEFKGQVVSEPVAIVALIVVILAILLVTVVPIVLTVSVYRGHNFSRLIVMLFSTVTIVTAIFAYTGSLGLDLQGGLVAFSLDIGVLLALSGEDAQRFARARGQERRLAKLQKRAPVLNPTSTPAQPSAARPPKE